MMCDINGLIQLGVEIANHLMLLAESYDYDLIYLGPSSGFPYLEQDVQKKKGEVH